MIEIIQADKVFFKEQLNNFKNLYELCFNLSTSIEAIEWRYLNNPMNDLFVCMAFEENKLVANYSVSPTLLTYDGEDIPAVLSLNTMTHPDYIGKGLFVELATKVYNFAYEKGYKLVFGFPNKISNRTFINRLNWHDIYEIPMLELNLENSTQIQPDKNIIYDNMFENDYSNFQIKDNIFKIKKDKRYLKWRYYNNPDIDYFNIIDLNSDKTVDGYIIYKEYKDKINIVDYSFLTIDVADKLVQQIKYIAVKLNKKYISTWAKLENPFHLLLEKNAFSNATPITYFGANFFNVSDKNFYGYNYSNWEIYLADDNSF